MRGWVYVITNPAMPGLVKVGFSTKDPDLRAGELNHTGSPHPYVVEYDVMVEFPQKIEQQVHSKLKVCREGKEWFRCTPEHAIEAIRHVVKDSAILENFKRVERERVESLQRQRAAEEKARKDAEIRDRQLQAEKMERERIERETEEKARAAELAEKTRLAKQDRQNSNNGAFAVLGFIGFVVFVIIAANSSSTRPAPSNKSVATTSYPTTTNNSQGYPPVKQYEQSNTIPKSSNNSKSVKFIVQDNCNDGISIQYRFFDVTNNLVWPSSDTVYTTSQNQIPSTHELSCSPNSNICFGATTYTATPTVYWGLGINNDYVTNIATSCVSCGSVSEKRLYFACPPKNEYIQQTQSNSPTNNKKKRIKSDVEMYAPPQPTGNSRTTTTTRQDYRTYNTNNDGMREAAPLKEKNPIEFSDLSPSQKASFELACFEAKVKGSLQFNECIKIKLSVYK